MPKQCIVSLTIVKQFNPWSMPITTGRPGKSENEKIVLQAYSANTITMVKNLPS